MSSLYPRRATFYEKVEPFIPTLAIMAVVMGIFLLSIIMVCHEGVLPSVQGPGV